MLRIALYLYSTRVFVYSVIISGWVLVCDLLDLSPYLYLCPILDSISESVLSPFSFSSLPNPRRRGPHNILDLHQNQGRTMMLFGTELSTQHNEHADSSEARQRQPM